LVDLSHYLQFVQVFVVLTILSCKYHQVKLLWLHRQGLVGPAVHPISIHWIITFAVNAGVLSQSAAEAKKQFLTLKMHFGWFGTPYRRKPLTMV